MSTRYVGGLITKTPPTLDPALGNAANGVFTMNQYMQAVKNATWPGFDPYFNQTVLSLHGNGTNGDQNNTFLDGSTNNFTITRNGNTTQGTFSPFSGPNGYWSNYFDGSGDSLTAPDNSALEIGSGDFTVEAWIYLTSYSASFSGDYVSAICGKDASSGRSYNFVVIGTASSFTSLQFRIYSNDSTSTGTTANFTFALHTWYHVAATRSGTSLRLYVNGTDIGGGTNSVSAQDSATTFKIGTIGFTGYEYWFPGYISNLRVVKGTAITPPSGGPTAPLTPVSGTSLLTCQSNRFVDNSTNAFAITRNGDVKVTPFSPFAPSAAYDPAVNGGSGYFDGTGDYLTLDGGTPLTFGTGNFTIEFWVYFNATGQQILYDARSGNVSSITPVIYRTSGNIIAYYVNGANRIEGTSTIPLNAWTYVAVTRSGTDTKLFINGVQEGSTYTDSNNYTIYSNRPMIGADGNVPTPTSFLNGYMAGLRVLKGTATTITVPTAPPTAITNTQLLLNFTNAGIFDNTGKNVLETVGNAQIDTGTKKYGTGSLEFDGTGDYLKFPDAINFNVGEDFTVEAWLYMTDAGTYTPRIQKYASTTEIAVFAVEKSGTIYAVFSSAVLNGGIAATTDNATSTISGQTWNHVAWVRSSGTLTFYINGSASGTVSLSTYKSQPLTLVGITNYSAGGAPGLYFPFNGYIDDLRITKGVARYTAAFTPQTSQWQDQ